MHMKLLSAPLQGYTEAAWRHAHAVTFGGADCYYTPFLRVEKGEVRGRDLRDLQSACCGTSKLVPQIIFRDRDEFKMLVEAVVRAGYNEVDLNMGCPFPPQVHKGRGSGIISRREVLEEVLEEMKNCNDCSFSVKMRLGASDSDEWRGIIDILNDMPLSHVAIHPRTGRQQYKGELDMDGFEALASALAHPVVFNGEIHTPRDIDALVSRYPQLYGVMAGRGLLARPSLFKEWSEGTEWTRQRLLSGVIDMHTMFFDNYTSRLCGETQILSKLVPFWEYLAPIVGSKTFKAIKKARTIVDYQKVINMLSEEC